MLSRINFLVAVGILAAIVLLLAGFYLVAKPTAAISPSWAPYALGAWVLIALALLVSILAQLHTRLQKAYGTIPARAPDSLGLAGQAMLYCGHIVVAAGAYRLLSDGSEFLPAVAVVATLIYAGGIAATLVDWRRRAA
jgi:hypothetical protein